MRPKLFNLIYNLLSSFDNLPLLNIAGETAYITGEEFDYILISHNFLILLFNYHNNYCHIIIILSHCIVVFRVLPN